MAGMMMKEQDAMGDRSMELQLMALYHDREFLERNLGVSEAAEIVAMVRSMEEQLKDVYQERERQGGEGKQVVGQIRALAENLRDLYPNRELVLQFDEGSAHIRAVWKAS